MRRHPLKGLVFFVLAAVGRTGHDAKNALGIENGCAIGLQLVANGGELIQRTAYLRLVLDNHLQTASLGIHDAEGIAAEEVGGIGDGAGLVLIVLAAQYRCENILNKATAVERADFTVENGIGPQP